MKYSPFPYRPEVDGLRAIAVLAVLLYHAGFGLPGGFVGVDVFFVLSGFLITGIMMKEAEAGAFNFRSFWLRRVRRILPASLATLIVTLVAGFFILLPADLLRLGISGGYQSLFAANIYFLQSVDYFAGPAEEVPLLHTWSLAVEEQYYFLFPLLFMGCLKIDALNKRARFIIITGTLWAISFVFSVIALYRFPEATFYLLPARAWEICSGALLAMLPARFLPKNSMMREASSFGGMALILGAILYYSKTTPFPGWSALPPVLGTFMILWSCTYCSTSNQEHELTSIGKLLATRSLVFIGHISYSLYLWHWPLFAYAQYWTFSNLTTLHSVILLAASAGMGVLSWRYIELPFRQKRILANNRSLIAFAIAVSLSTLAVSVYYWKAKGVPSRYTTEVASLASKDKINRINVKLDDIKAKQLPSFGVDVKDRPPDLLLWGDSHARTYLPAFDKLANELNLSGRLIAYSATLPLLEYHAQPEHGLGSGASGWARATIDYIAANNIPDVFLAAYWSNPRLNTNEMITIALKETIDAIRSAGARVWIILSVPGHDYDVPRALAFSKLGRLRGTDWQRTPAEHYALQEPVLRAQALVDDINVLFIDPAPGFIEGEGDSIRHYKVLHHGEKIYYDDHHLREWFVVDVLYKLLYAAVVDLIDRPTSRY